MPSTIPEIDSEYLLETLVDLLEIPSPTGFTDRAMDRVAEALGAFPDLSVVRTPKGALVATWPGRQADAPRALTAHVDTLGAMVRAVKENGRLKLTRLGGYAWNTIEGEGCTVFARRGKSLRGAVLLTQASGHVHGLKVGELTRDSDTLEVRLDARTASAEETRALGVEVGDLVALDPRVELNEGFIRSRHLDDKAGVACVLAAVQAIHAAGGRPAQTTTLHISNYEEVGHGAAAGIPGDVVELVTVDMAVVGEGQQSDEFHPTLCVKDSRGPYHRGLSQKLCDLADALQIPYRVDVYPYYGSDGEAFWRAGGDVAVALIGPGVDASHNYERTHREALLGTARWLAAYLLD
jgi:putative aminopeptidase FrvX